MPISDILAALRWWTVLLLLGAAAAPLTMRLFGRLPDRGYAFTKMVGLLVVSYLFWLLSSLGFLDNSLGGILLAVGLLVALSIWASRTGSGEDQGRPGFVAWLRNSWRYVLLAEVVFAVIFGLWVWVRSQNPAISATEKPMEFAFLNSVSRSPGYPPLDPWLSGFAISYYYFGYVMTSVILRLAAVSESVGFNLGIAWLAAGSAVGAFGLTYNLIAIRGESARRAAVVLGLVGALALPIAGNLEIVLEVLHSRGIGTAGFWEWLDVRDLNGPPQASAEPRYETSQWWWWRSSRVIHEYHLSGRPEEGLEPIAEFPGFSFVLGDMHPHVLALPFAFLSLAVAYSWWLSPPLAKIRGGDLLSPNQLKLALGDLTADEWIRWAFAALVLGGLSFLNTWDVLIHLFVLLGAYVLGRWRMAGRWDNGIWGQALAVAVLLVAPIILLYLPFYLGFRSQAGPPFLLPMTMRPTRLAHFLIIFGMPLTAIGVLIATLVFRSAGGLPTMIRARHWRAGLTITVALLLFLFALMLLLGWVVSFSPDASDRTIALADELGLELPEQGESASALLRARWAASAVINLAPTFIQSRLQFPGLTLMLAALLAVVVAFLASLLQPLEPAQHRSSGSASLQSLPFALLMIGTAALLTLGPEFVFLKDNFGQRLNTIFKFYYQAWVLYGIAALFALDFLLQYSPRVGILASTGYGLSLAASLMFPILAISSRSVEYRGPASAENRLPATLDGMAHLARYNSDELEAIEWLREAVHGNPVILEAVGGQYSAYGRISASTGFPTVLGWAGHEYQWRGNTPEPAERASAVESIYGSADWERTAGLLNNYKIAYIYYGPLERSTYDARSEEKFDEHLEVAYRNGSVTIYRWQPQ